MRVRIQAVKGGMYKEKGKRHSVSLALPGLIMKQYLIFQ